MARKADRFLVDIRKQPDWVPSTFWLSAGARCPVELLNSFSSSDT